MSRGKWAIALAVVVVLAAMAPVCYRGEEASAPAGD
jgi:hypothetical protein